MGGCFTTCFSCSYILPTRYFRHCSVQNIWLDGHLIWHSMALLMSSISSVNHWTCTTELQLPNFKHWLHIVTSVSPLWTNALGIKSRHCSEHTMERIHASLFQIILLDMLLSSYSLLRFPYGNRERGGPVLGPSWAGLWSAGLMKRPQGSTSLFID